MAKTKAKQPNKQTADASQPTSRQPLAEQPVGERRRTFWVGIACALAGAGLWGVSGACAQHLFSHYGITPMFATAVRSLVATLFFEPSTRTRLSLECWCCAAATCSS